MRWIEKGRGGDYHRSSLRLRFLLIAVENDGNLIMQALESDSSHV